MHNSIKKLLIAGFTVLGISACSIINEPVVNTIQLNDADLTNISNIKIGKSCTTSILGLFGPFGDANLIKAIEDGGIKKIVSSDTKIESFGLITRNCIRVYGY
ncbi:MAG: hypothetical protein J6C50_02070 [Rickettsiales bacterium]|nr:hypothetical protein [Rickettsiales bacterium]